MSRKRRGGGDGGGSTGSSGNAAATSGARTTRRRRRESGRDPNMSSNGLGAAGNPMRLSGYDPISRVHRLLAPQDELAKLNSNEAVVVNLRSGDRSKSEAACMVLATWFYQALNCPGTAARDLNRHLQDLIEHHGLLAGLTDAWSATNMRKINEAEIAKKSACLSVLTQCASYIFHIRNRVPLNSAEATTAFLSKEALYCMMASFDEVLLKLVQLAAEAQDNTAQYKTYRTWFSRYSVDFLSFVMAAAEVSPDLIMSFLKYPATVPTCGSSLFGGRPLADYLLEVIIKDTLQSLLCGYTRLPFNGQMCILAVEVVRLSASEKFIATIPLDVHKQLLQAAMASSDDHHLLSVRQDPQWLSLVDVALLSLRLLRASGRLCGQELIQQQQQQQREFSTAFLALLLRNRGEQIFTVMTSSLKRPRDFNRDLSTDLNRDGSSGTMADDQHEAADECLIECCDSLESLVIESLDLLDCGSAVSLFGECLAALERFRVDGFTMLSSRSDQRCVWCTLVAIASELSHVCLSSVLDSQPGGAESSAFASLEGAAMNWFGLLGSLGADGTKVNVRLDDETTDDLYTALQLSCSLLAKGLSHHSNTEPFNGRRSLCDERVARVYIETLTAIESNLKSSTLNSTTGCELLTSLCPIFEILGNTEIADTVVSADGSLDRFILKRLVTRILLLVVLVDENTTTTVTSASLLACGAQCLIDNYQDAAYDKIAVEEGLTGQCPKFVHMLRSDKIMHMVKEAFATEADSDEDVEAFIEYYRCLLTSLSSWDSD